MARDSSGILDFESHGNDFIVQPIIASSELIGPIDNIMSIPWVQ